ncbi:MAG TPA: hypothetical protein VN721_11045 [Flavipsychrobacter sp.]|nr:hypothetical protein [Flavipsychrobacter sp.]
MRTKFYTSLLASVLIFYSCSNTISLYDQCAYAQTTSAKVDALNFMNLATNDYNAHQKDITDIQTELQKAYEYEKHRQKNVFTIKMWDILLDSNGHLFGGFIKRWENEGKLKKAYIDDKKKEIGNAFDEIAELESKKTKQSQASGK